MKSIFIDDVNDYDKLMHAIVEWGPLVWWYVSMSSRWFVIGNVWWFPTIQLIVRRTNKSNRHVERTLNFQLQVPNNYLSCGNH